MSADWIRVLTHFDRSVAILTSKPATGLPTPAHATALFLLCIFKRNESVRVHALAALLAVERLD